MMGTRESQNGDESDAFSRRARRLLPWRRGEIPKIKRRFWKRTRRDQKVGIRRDAAKEH